MSTYFNAGERVFLENCTGMMMMKRYTMGHFTGTERKIKNLEKQISIISRSDKTLRRIRKRKRDPQETVLLIKAMMNDLRRLEREGIVQKNGRQWKLNL